jgi:protease-4
MAVGGDKILAEPNTITGSIGVFATVPNLSEVSEKVGINAEQVGTHHFSMDYSFFEPMRDDFREVLREGIDQTYQTFLDRVAQGRKITKGRADSLAQGRVWSGKQALENGLIDGLGGMPEALEMAADMAEISDFKLKILPRFKTGIERLMEDLGAGQMNTEQWITSELGPEWGRTLIALKQIFELEGVHARMPFTLNIK